MSNQLSFEINGRKADLPLYTGSEGETAIDISKLRSQTGTITLDPGYVNTGACTSGITFLNGEEGILRYRGYPIEQLAENSSFLEVSYLLIHGELPNAEQLEDFEGNITRHTMLHEDLRHIYQAFPKGAHPMAMLSSVVNALSTFYPDFSATDQKGVDLAIWRLMGKMPTIAGWAFKKNIGQPFIYPRNDLDYASNFLRMCFAVPAENYEVNPILSRAMDRIFTLHADHEQNASTSTVRLASSSGANPFACIAAGIACLWGPAHGGANQACLEMLREIGSADRIPEFIQRAKDKNDPFRLMGFGHRVYKNTDPRAKVLKRSADEVLDLLGFENNPLLQVAKDLEKMALNDDYFADKKLFPNVDFYSGIILEAMGFPTSMFTPIFAVSRTVGWISQWKEMIADPQVKIGRPRQLYLGESPRDYTDIETR